MECAYLSPPTLTVVKVKIFSSLANTPQYHGILEGLPLKVILVKSRSLTGLHCDLKSLLPAHHGDAR